MSEAVAWREFFLMTGGAAAALAGLIFIAISIHARAIMSRRLAKDRAFASVISLLSQVLLSGAALVPDQPPLALGLEIEGVAAFFLYRTLVVPRRIPEAVSRLRRRESSWLIDWFAWCLWMGVLIASGIALGLGIAGGFYLLALSMAFMFFANVRTAWLLIADIAE
jgi:hypothetical protein